MGRKNNKKGGQKYETILEIFEAVGDRRSVFGSSSSRDFHSLLDSHRYCMAYGADRRCGPGGECTMDYLGDAYPGSHRGTGDLWILAHKKSFWGKKGCPQESQREEIQRKPLGRRRRGMMPRSAGKRGHSM